MSSAHPLLPPLPLTTFAAASSSSSSFHPSPPSSRYFVPSVLEAASDRGFSSTYVPHPSLSIATSVTAQSAGVGLLVSAVQNALDKHDKGAMGIFTRTGGTIAFFAAMGFTYSFSTAAIANVRETNDALNAAAGGCAAGLLAGARAHSLPLGVGACAVMATLMGSFDAAGKSLTGDRLSIPRPEREERRLAFFKKPKMAAAVDGEEA